MAEPRIARRTRLQLTKMRLAGWLNRKRHPRLADMLRHPWWDWGNRLMAITGESGGGHGVWDVPGMGAWYYRPMGTKPMWRTGYPRQPLSTVLVIKDYRTFRDLTEGLDEDALYEWRAFYMDQDGEIRMGRQYWGKPFYGLDTWEALLLQEYLRAWRRHDWYGLRTWLYSLGLNAAVYQRKPFTCRQAPPRGSGGYDHWLCRERRNHQGPHRYKSYEWTDGGHFERVEEANA